MADSDSAAPTRRPRGRPMSVEIERRLMDGALRALAEHGHADLTVKMIAEMAGVPRRTFYRRWQTVPEAMAAAIKTLLAVTNPVAPDTGDAREDFAVLGRNMATMLTSQPFGRILGFISSQMSVDPDFREAIMDILVERRRPADQVLAKGKAKGQLDDRFDTELLIELMCGALIFRVLFGRTPPDAAYVDRLIDVILPTRGSDNRIAADTPSTPAKPATAER